MYVLETWCGMLASPQDFHYQNYWAVEVGNEKYIYELLLRVIRLSVETVEIVQALPMF